MIWFGSWLSKSISYVTRVIVFVCFNAIPGPFCLIVSTLIDYLLDPIKVSMEHFQIESNIVRCPNPEYAEKMIAAIDAVRVRGDSVGGVVTCIARNVPRVSSSPTPTPTPPATLKRNYGS